MSSSSLGRRTGDSGTALRVPGARPGSTVDRFHAAALAAGGRDNGAPGERSITRAHAAFVLDPDGTNVEAVYHGPVERSAPSVVFTWDA